MEILENVEKDIFHMNIPERKGSFWWKFWLFFWDIEKEKPKQLLILWSTKNDKVLDCNGIEFRLNIEKIEKQEKIETDGVVASWFFDGEEMHENYLLEKGKMVFDEKNLSFEFNGKNNSEFYFKNGKFIVKLNKDNNNYEFENVIKNAEGFLKPNVNRKEIAGIGYEVYRVSRTEMKGKVNGKEISGSSYFQKVTVNAPMPPWFWGIYHFPDGSAVTYYMPYIGVDAFAKDYSKTSGKKFRKIIYQNCYYLDAESGKNYEFYVKEIERQGIENPVFVVKGEKDGLEIEIKIESYSETTWSLKKKCLFGKKQLLYSEYPAKVSRLTIKKGNEVIISRKDNAIGNAEHSIGFL